MLSTEAIVLKLWHLSTIAGRSENTNYLVLLKFLVIVRFWLVPHRCITTQRPYFGYGFILGMAIFWV